jgi:hypothetical protein
MSDCLVWQAKHCKNKFYCILGKIFSSIIIKSIITALRKESIDEGHNEQAEDLDSSHTNHDMQLTI